MNKILAVTLFILLVVLAVWFLSSGNSPMPQIHENQPATNQTVSGISADPTDPFKGKLDAPITLIYVGSFSCPSCKDAAPIMDQLLALYPDTLKVVWKDLPETLGDSYRAAIAARCAQQQGKFWQYHELVMQNQDILTTQTLYSLWARNLGLNMNAFNTCFEGEQTRQYVDRDANESLRAGITAVPYFQINDNEGISGLQSIGYFRGVIDSALASLKK